MKNNLLFILLIVAVALAGHLIAYEMFHIPKQIGFVVIFVVFLFYPVVRFPLVGVYAVFIVSPFIPFVRRLFYLVHGRPGTDPLIVLSDVLIIMIFLGLFFEFREHPSEQSDTKKFTRIVSIYFFYMILRAFVFNIATFAEGLQRLKYYAPAVLLFFIGIYFGRDFKLLKRLWLLTIVVGIAGCVYGLKQLFIGYSAAEKLWFATTYFSTLFIKGVARPFSFFQAPAAFADYLVISIIGVLMFLYWGRFKGKIFIMLLVPLFFYGILITSVRSNWIGALSVFFIWFVVLQIRNNTHRIIIIAIAFLCFFMYQFFDDSLKADLKPEALLTVLNGKLGNQEYVDLMVTSRTGALTNPFEENSMLSRIALWKYLFLLTEDPQMAIFGRGVGALNADSLYVTYLAEFGYPGLIFIVFLLCALVIKGFKALGSLSDPRTVILTKGIIAFDLAFALMSFTGTHIHTFPGDVYLWFWNGVLMNVQLLDKKLIEENENTVNIGLPA
jgi:hypothetical protein